MTDNNKTPDILNREKMFQPYSQQDHFSLESTEAIYTKYRVKLCIQLPQAIAACILNWTKVMLSPSFYRCKIQAWREEASSTKQA